LKLLLSNGLLLNRKIGENKLDCKKNLPQQKRYQTRNDIDFLKSPILEKEKVKNGIVGIRIRTTYNIMV
jgi:hypothetical protein